MLSSICVDEAKMRVLKRVPTLKQVKEQNPNLKALIFDMDGTLFNSEPVHAMAHKNVLEHFAGNSPLPISVQEVESRYKGLADNLVCERFKEDKLMCSSVKLEDFRVKKGRVMIDDLPSVKLSDVFDANLMELITEAKNDGMKVALCTASEREITHSMLNHFDFFKYFNLVKTNEDFSNSKPHPEPYLKTINELSVDSSEVVIFEDSEAGVQSAKDSGAPMYKVEWYL